MSFCALCTTELTPADGIRYLDGEYRICEACDTERPREKNGPDRPYEVGGGGSLLAIRQAADKVLGPAEVANAHWKRRDLFIGASDLRGHRRYRTPGWLLVRKQVLGRELVEVIITMRDETRFAEHRYLGSTKGYFLFERPDPAVAAEQRKPSGNPLINIEAYRTK